MENLKKRKLGSEKHERKAQVTVSEPKNTKLAPNLAPNSPKRQQIESIKSAKKSRMAKPQLFTEEVTIVQAPKPLFEKKKTLLSVIPDSSDYSVLKDKELIDKFMKVPLTNNQKGRIRQTIKAQLQNSDATLFPDIINGKIQAILKSAENLTDSDLRRIRILHNMLKSTLETVAETDETVDSKKKAKKHKKNKKEKDEQHSKDKVEQKVKGPKRYVVFLGNLPLDITKEKIMNHFAELNEHIKDIRIQKPNEGKKKAFAYVELSNEPSFELCLSKHHSMLGSNRINVLYTTQQKSKVSKAEAKSKRAKLIALHKAGQLVGSLPLSKKRSHRRMILKKARAKAEAEGKL